MGHQAPLYRRKNESPEQAKLNVEWAVNYWLSKGCPKEKLLMGLALYGRSFTYSGDKNLGAPATGAGSQGRVSLFLLHFIVVIDFIFYLNMISIYLQKG